MSLETLASAQAKRASVARTASTKRRAIGIAFGEAVGDRGNEEVGRCLRNAGRSEFGGRMQGTEEQEEGWWRR